MKKLRLCGTPDELIEKIKILANDKCEPVSQFMRPVIREISKKYEGIEKTNSDCSELQLTEISDAVVEKLEIAANKIGVTVPQLLRLEFYLFIENQSEFNKSLFETG